MLIARTGMTGSAGNIVQLHMRRVFAGDVRVRGSVRGDAMAGITLSRNRIVTLRAGRSALRHPAQIRTMTRGIGAARGTVGSRVTSMVGAGVS